MTTLIDDNILKKVIEIMKNLKDDISHFGECSVRSKNSKILSLLRVIFLICMKKSTGPMHCPHSSTNISSFSTPMPSLAIVDNFPPLNRETETAQGFYNLFIN